MFPAVLFVFLATPPAGPPQDAGLEIEEIPLAAGPGAGFANLARTSAGDVVLSWLEHDDEGGGEGGKGTAMRIAYLDGDAWGPARTVVRGEDLLSNWADFPSVAALGSGTLLAQWLRRDGAGHAYSVLFALSADRGQTWSAPRSLHDDRSLVEHGFVSLVQMDGDGDEETFGAIWLDGRQMANAEPGAGEMALYHRTVGADGTLGEERVLDARVCDCCQTSLVVTTGGSLLAAYRDRDAAETRDISIVEFDRSMLSPPRSIHDDGWEIDGCPVNGPRIDVHEGVVTAAWFTGAGGGGGSVRVAFRDPGTDEFDDPIDVDEGLPVGRVDVVTTSPDAAVVTWLEHSGEGGGATWRARRVARDGTLWPSLTVDTVPAERVSGFLRMVPRGVDLILAWTALDGEPSLRTARLRTVTTPR